MTKKTKIADLPEFDMAEYLDSEQAMAEYLTIVLEENDPSALAGALGSIARARGMSEIAKASGITREALYKALRPDAQPRFDTVNRVCAALGCGWWRRRFMRNGHLGLQANEIWRKQLSNI